MKTALEFGDIATETHPLATATGDCFDHYREADIAGDLHSWWDYGNMNVSGGTDVIVRTDGRLEVGDHATNLNHWENQGLDMWGGGTTLTVVQPTR